MPQCQICRIHISNMCRHTLRGGLQLHAREPLRADAHGVHIPVDWLPQAAVPASGSDGAAARASELPCSSSSSSSSNGKLSPASQPDSSGGKAKAQGTGSDVLFNPQHSNAAAASGRCAHGYVATFYHDPALYEREREVLSSAEWSRFTAAIVAAFPECITSSHSEHTPVDTDAAITPQQAAVSSGNSMASAWHRATGQQQQQQQQQPPACGSAPPYACQPSPPLPPAIVSEAGESLADWAARGSADALMTANTLVQARFVKITCTYLMCHYLHYCCSVQ